MLGEAKAADKEKRRQLIGFDAAELVLSQTTTLKTKILSASFSCTHILYIADWFTDADTNERVVLHLALRSGTVVVHVWL